VRKRISAEAYTVAVRRPRTRYRNLSVNRTGRLVAAGPLPRSWRCVWYQKDLEVEDHGAYYRDDESYVVTMFVDGIASVLFYVEKNTLDSVCFSFLLKPFQIAEAIRAMRAEGLGRLVRQAAEHTLDRAPKTVLPMMKTALERYVSHLRKPGKQSGGPRSI